MFYLKSLVSSSPGAVYVGVWQLRLGPGARAVLRGPAEAGVPVQRRPHLLSSQQDAPAALPGGHLRSGQQQARLRLLAVQSEGSVHQEEERHHDRRADDGEDDTSQVSREEGEGNWRAHNNYFCSHPHAVSFLFHATYIISDSDSPSPVRTPVATPEPEPEPVPSSRLCAFVCVLVCDTCVVFEHLTTTLYLPRSCSPPHFTHTDSTSRSNVSSELHSDSLLVHQIPQVLGRTEAVWNSNLQRRSRQIMLFTVEIHVSLSGSLSKHSMPRT